MGYVKNHLATLVSGAFAVVLSGLYFPLVDFAPQLQFVFIMAVPNYVVHGLCMLDCSKGC